MAVVFGAIGAADSGTTRCDPSYPSGVNATTSVLYAIVTGRCSVAATAFPAPTGPDWTSLGQLEDGTGTYGTDTGTRRVAFFKKNVVTGAETSAQTQAFTFPTGDNTSTISATIFRLDKTAGFTISEQFASGADTANGTGYSAISSTSLAWETGDLLCIGVAQNIDTGTQSAQSITASGVTFGTRSNRVGAAVNNGADHRRILDTVPVSSASTTAAATYAYTISAAGSGPTAFLIVREASAPVTVGLSGERSDMALGSMAALTQQHGQVMTLSQGTLAVGPPSVALTGSESASAAGTLVPVLPELQGQAATLAQGALTPVASPALIGSALAGSKGPGGALSLLFLGGTASYQGTPTVTIRPTDVVGQVITGATGTLVAAGPASGSVHLSGVEATFVAGTVDGGRRTISGQVLTSAAGTLVANMARPLSGVEATFASGTIAAEQDAVDTWIVSGYGTPIGSMAVAMLGAAATGAQGDVGLSGDAALALTGEASTAAAGTLVPAIAPALIGAQFVGAQQSVGAPGGVQLTGSEATAAAGTLYLTPDRIYALTGIATTVQDGITFASSLAFPLGQAITSGLGEIGPRTVALTGQAIICRTGQLEVERTRPPHGHGHKPPKPPKHIAMCIDDECITATEEDLALAIETIAKAAAAKAVPGHEPVITVKGNITRHEKDAIREALLLEYQRQLGMPLAAPKKPRTKKPRAEPADDQEDIIAAILLL